MRHEKREIGETLGELRARVMREFRAPRWQGSQQAIDLFAMTYENGYQAGVDAVIRLLLLEAQIANVTTQAALDALNGVAAGEVLLDDERGER